MMKNRVVVMYLLFIMMCLSWTQTTSQNPSALYQNWVDAQVNNTEPTLPTFSYAGYHNGDIGLPNSFTQQVYDVTDVQYAGGAVADDDISDKAAIIAAIDAAALNPNGGIIFFPPGRFVVNDATVDNRNEIIYIRKSNIVIKGSGSGAGGTELYHKDYTDPTSVNAPWSSPFLFQFRPSSTTKTLITGITGNTTRETFTIEVTSTANITVGQWVELNLTDTSSTAVNEELLPYSTADFFEPNSLKIVTEGVSVREFHKVVSKTSTTVTFKEPIHKTINASYNWNLYTYPTIEEVGIQDLKYTGGYIWNFLHHQAPQELFPGEVKSGPNSFLSDSGWSGVQFINVVNGWITNVEFSQMSQVGQFKISTNCTAIYNKYVGNSGHVFISANAGSHCFIGKNMDVSTGVWHGCGVNAQSIGNVLWRNEMPQTGTVGMEIHASQPRATLSDVCKGGVFFNQGGSTGSLPNHLRHFVLWNFEGVSYQATNVKSWRPISETKYAKFLMPIISGLVGFTMSTDANQFQVNESQGTHVDETSLYEKQLSYRLGSLPTWVTETIASTGVSVSPSVMSLPVEGTTTLTASIIPFSASNKSIVWSSSNNNIATVNSNGLVTALSFGTATITATTGDGGYTDTSTITVDSYTETLENMSLVGWGTETYTGNSGITWNIDAKGTSGYIENTKDIYMRSGKMGVSSGTITGGISSFSVSCKDLWDETESRTLELWINGSIYDTYTHVYNGGVYTYEVNNINLEGDFTLGLKNASTTEESKSIAIDNIIWKPYTGTMSVDKYAKKKSRVYSNPFSPTIKIELEDDFTDVYLYDTYGRLIYKQDIKGRRKVDIVIDAKGTLSGMYILRLIGANGNEAHKLIKMSR